MKWGSNKNRRTKNRTRFSFKYRESEISVLSGQQDINNKLKKSNIFVEQKKKLGHRTRKDVQLNFYQTMELQCLKYGSETWTPRQMKMIGSSRDAVLTECSRFCTTWDNENSCEIRPQLGKREMEKQWQQRKKIWLEHLQRCLQKELPSNSQNQPI
jgi:hypothetical protein